MYFSILKAAKMDRQYSMLCATLLNAKEKKSSYVNLVFRHLMVNPVKLQQQYTLLSSQTSLYRKGCVTHKVALLCFIKLSKNIWHWDVEVGSVDPPDPFKLVSMGFGDGVNTSD